jgi:GT2 family glycosyltransferase
MRVLALIFSFNDVDVIEQTIAAVAAQSRPVDEILVVDNASTDGTLDQPSLRNVTVRRHSENLGASGAICTGFRYALERDYDWIWTFDADAAPEPDALDYLLSLYSSFPDNLRKEIAFLACLHRNAQDGEPLYYRSRVLGRFGWMPARPVPERRFYACHFTTWSGCFYRIEAVRRIGLPNPHYFADWGEAEYGYRIMKAGYKGFTHQDAIHNHDVRGYASLRPLEIRRGVKTVTVLRFPPLRSYYTARNRLYLVLYDFDEVRPWVILRVFWQLGIMAGKLLARPRTNAANIPAFFRGVWHGLTGNLAARY